MIINKIARSFLLLFVLLIGSISADAQTIVKGFVRDAITKQPVPFVSVVFKGSKGTTTGEDGSYAIKTLNPRLTILQFTCVGYKPVTKIVEVNQEQTVDIEMEPTSLIEVTVKSKKRPKYSNKNNPAVDLIEKVIANKSKNRVTAYDYVQYQQYEKMDLALTSKPEKLLKKKIFRNYAFIAENIDTTTLDGRALIPIYVEEKLSQKYYRKSPEKEKTYVIAEKKVNFGEFVDDAGVSAYLKRLYADIDIYTNNVTILTTQFLSPIADASPTFYRFYIRDTVEEDGIKLVKMYFTPKNPNDLLFRGTMFITLDGNYAVQKINMTISKNANLNWTNELRIAQDFEKGSDSRYHVIKSSMLAEFALTKKSSGSVFGQRVVSFKDFMINTPGPDSVYKGKSLVLLTDPSDVPDSFWVANRHEKLSEAEAKTYENIDSLRNMRSYKTLMNVGTLLFAGYFSLGKYEIGNTNTFYSFNDVEGFRLRVGGRSTPKLSKSFYFENFIAYGFEDKKYKYALATTYSFNHKSIYSFPLNYARLTYQYDTKIPGQDLQFVSEDNFLLSFKRGPSAKYLYNRSFKAEYVREFGKNFSVNIGARSLEQTPAGNLYFEKEGGVSVSDVKTTELSTEFRWAPNEQFYQTKASRVPIANKYPVFRLKVTAGIKDLFGGQYNFQSLILHINKRFYLSQLGYADVTLEGGYINGQVPYPLLTIHRANQTYGFQLNSYNMMNFMEFVSDRYGSGSFDFYFNGFLFNKIPGLKKLKLREVASAKVLYGSLRDENNPDKNPDTFKFPTDQYGQPTTFNLNEKPYIELSAGIANIFKLVRLDVVKRVSYLENPGVPEWGLRARIRFDF